MPSSIAVHGISVGQPASTNDMMQLDHDGPARIVLRVD
jgi:hypothetical protein